MAQDLFRTSVSKPPFGRTPDSQRRGREEHLFGPAETRRPRHPLGSGSTRAWWAPGNVRIEAGPVLAAWRPPDDPGPGCVPLLRTRLRPGACCPTGQDTQPTFPTVSESRRTGLRPHRGSANPHGVTEPGSVARPEKAPPFQAWRGRNVHGEGPCNGPALAKPGSRPTCSGDTRLWRSCSWPGSHRAQGGPGVGPGVGWPAPASSSLPP